MNRNIELCLDASKSLKLSLLEQLQIVLFEQKIEKVSLKNYSLLFKHNNS